MANDIESTTIEFHRFGGEADSLQKGKRYIRTCGYQKAAEEVTVEIEPRELRRSLNRLRYGFDRTAESEAAAKKILGAEAHNFLPPQQLSPTGGVALRQVDIVTHASELRAYPFEAIYANASNDYLKSTEQGMILTRRIRSEFSYMVPPWPEVPSVLFVHAQLDHDLSQDLVDQHYRALSEALAPWGNPERLTEKKLLLVKAVDSVEALQAARELADFSYIHILAHGAKVAEEDVEESDTEWGLRLGGVGAAATSLKSIAEALRLINERPLVVTLAACDGGNADRPELGNSSLVETLHRNGIPVVVASQLPMTQPGSITLTKHFYRPLLSGTDVRIALHAARVALREEARQFDDQRHDWLSLVGYVRLPAEGYSQYLRTFGLRVRLHMLEAARSDAEPLLAETPPPRETFERVAVRLRDQIAHLAGQGKSSSVDQDRTLQAERVGLLASANKSLAEVRFIQACRFPDEKDRLHELSRAALEDSLRWYLQIYRHDMTMHWHGIQALALEAALTGRIADPVELMIVGRIAQGAIAGNQKEYWACGTLAEVLLLTALGPEGFNLTLVQDELNRLCKRSAEDLADKGFAVKSTRRQLARYATWWTKPNGYFPGHKSDLSAHAREMIGCLPG
jgi:hypothetical protein